MLLSRCCYVLSGAVFLHLALSLVPQIDEIPPIVVHDSTSSISPGESAGGRLYASTGSSSPGASGATAKLSKPPSRARPLKPSEMVATLHKTGAEPVIVGFDEQGREILDVPDFSNALLVQPKRTGLPPVSIQEPSGAGEILEVIDNRNSQLVEAQYAGAPPHEVEGPLGDTVLEVTSWPTVYEVQRTGTEPYEIYDPYSGTTILEAD